MLYNRRSLRISTRVAPAHRNQKKPAQQRRPSATKNNKQIKFFKKNPGQGCHFLLQGTFPTLGSNLHLLQWQEDSLPLSHQGNALSNLCKSKQPVTVCHCKSSRKLFQSLNEVRATLHHSLLCVYLQSGLNVTVALAQLMGNRKEGGLKPEFPGSNPWAQNGLQTSSNLQHVSQDQGLHSTKIYSPPSRYQALELQQREEKKKKRPEAVQCKILDHGDNQGRDPFFYGQLPFTGPFIKQLIIPHCCILLLSYTKILYALGYISGLSMIKHSVDLFVYSFSFNFLNLKQILKNGNKILNLQQSQKNCIMNKGIAIMEILHSLMLCYTLSCIHPAVHYSIQLSIDPSFLWCISK